MLKWLKKLWPTNGQPSSLRDEERAPDDALQADKKPVDYLALYHDLEALRTTPTDKTFTRVYWQWCMTEPAPGIQGHLREKYNLVKAVFDRHGVELDPGFRNRMLAVPQYEWEPDIRWAARLKMADLERGGWF